MFITNNRASLHLRWNENLVKHQKVSKYYENDCTDICISWYSKICLFPVKKCWCQQILSGVSRGLIFFLDLYKIRYNCVKFHHCRICNRFLGICRCPPSPIYDEPWKRPFCIGLIWHSWVAILESYYHFSNQHFRICQNARLSVKQEKSNNSSTKNA